MLKVSIITVCYNSEKHIENTIQSVLYQSYKNIEYIIIDGNSNDKTLGIIDKYKSEIGYFISEPDKGIYDAMNKGLNRASGDIVGFINSDDFYTHNNVIKSVVDVFDKNKVDSCFGKLNIVNQYNTKKIIRRYNTKFFKPWFLNFGIMPPHPAFFVRKNILQKIKGFNTNYQIVSDFELFLRLFKKEKISFTYLNKLLVIMRDGGISNNGIMSKMKITKEILNACNAHKVYTNKLMLNSRFLYKLSQKIL